MGQKARRWFLTWGIFIAVFVVRGLLPLALVWILNPALGPVGSFMATINGDPVALATVKSTAPILLAGGGIFLILLFTHWLFLEDKHYGLSYEHVVYRFGAWFYTVASVVLLVTVWFAMQVDVYIALSAVVGSTVFFITHGFKQHAKAKEEELLDGTSTRSDMSKILYLEAIDATFSIDGVLGAFAFTMSIPLILLGNGLGAIVVRQLTAHNITRIDKYIYLKNGAMYSAGVLGLVMVAHAFHIPIPEWVSPIITVALVGYFFLKSHQHIKQSNTKNPSLAGA